MKRKDPASLKRARKRAGLTQRELALLVRCSQTMIYLLEKPGPHGIDTCSDALATEICRRLHVDVEDLFERRASPSRPPVSSVRRRTSQPAAPADTLAPTAGTATFAVISAVTIFLEAVLLVGLVGIGAR